MKKLMKSEICRSCEQCTGPTDVAENELKSQIMRLLFMNSSRTFNFAELNACQKNQRVKRAFAQNVKHRPVSKPHLNVIIVFFLCIPQRWEGEENNK